MLVNWRGACAVACGLMIALAVGACGGGDTGTPCENDADCKGDRVCLNSGKCSEPGGGSSAGPDPIPECSGDGSACGEGRTCAEDGGDLWGGYCSPDCPAVPCPDGTRCADPGLCMVECQTTADCPRPYQICDDFYDGVGGCESAPCSRVCRKLGDCKLQGDCLNSSRPYSDCIQDPENMAAAEAYTSNCEANCDNTLAYSAWRECVIVNSKTKCDSGLEELCSPQLP